jgi:hypothetical protein
VPDGPVGSGSIEPYDVVLLSCEGAQNPATEPTAALQAMKDHADRGGRVYLGHWHNHWLSNGPNPWPSIVAFNFGLGTSGRSPPTSSTSR